MRIEFAVFTVLTTTTHFIGIAGITTILSTTDHHGRFRGAGVGVTQVMVMDIPVTVGVILDTVMDMDVDIILPTMVAAGAAVVITHLTIPVIHLTQFTQETRTTTDMEEEQLLVRET